MADTTQNTIPAIQAKIEENYRLTIEALIDDNGFQRGYYHGRISIYEEMFHALIPTAEEIEALAKTKRMIRAEYHGRI